MTVRKYEFYFQLSKMLREKLKFISSSHHVILFTVCTQTTMKKWEVKSSIYIENMPPGSWL